MNWYVGQDDVFGYHIVNILIHILTAWFLFLTLHLLLHIHYKKQYPPNFFTAAALLAALLWALAPIQTQAVTYIVQRMASMAAMFTIIALYSYLRGRTEKKIWFFICLLSYCAAIGSKENALLLPFSLLLIELSFFHHHFKKTHIGIFIFAAVTALVCIFLLLRYGLNLTVFRLSNPLSFLDGYDSRSFTFIERILTQPQIVLMYLSQIFFPSTERLSIEHDITLSTSLLTPWTTLPAILTIFLLIVASLAFLKKYPLVCFPVLFFFLNHSSESTILPLELIFEHRNYLPSFFLFLPISIFVAHALYHSDFINLSSFGRIAIVFCATFFLIISGHATYTRNLAWATEQTLWSDVIHKAPNSARAAHNIGRWYRQFGQYQRAYHFFQLAYKNSNTAASPERSKKRALNGMGTIPYILSNYKQSLQYFDQCLQIKQNDESCLKNRMLTYLQLNQPEKALSDGLNLTNAYPDPIEYQYLIATAAYQANHNDIAIIYVQNIAGRSLRNHQVMHLAGLLMMQEEAYPNSLFFLQQAAKLSANDIDSQLALASAYYAVNKLELTEKILHEIFWRNPLPVIVNAVENAKKYNTESNPVGFIEEYIDSMIETDMVAKKTHDKRTPHRHSDLQQNPQR
ncbi:MAG: tetratricopeptide repeat protein [Candidatus Electrothrix sp. MAN1_4]|nr:tetratricopeptide repeat protein [Candidatus Electrothrix sp. MAN1_4]